MASREGAIDPICALIAEDLDPDARGAEQALGPLPRSRSRSAQSLIRGGGATYARARRMGARETARSGQATRGLASTTADGVVCAEKAS